MQTRPLSLTPTALRGLQVNAAIGNGSLIVEAATMQDGSLIARSEPITKSVSDGVGKANLVWYGTLPGLKSRQSCVLRFVIAGDATVFSFVFLKN